MNKDMYMNYILLALISLLVIEVSFLVYTTVRRTPSSKGRKVYIDTSALMDGRIVTAARTGFIPDHLVIPSSVIAELQLLADQADSEKRARARRGLDAIRELQEIEQISVKIIQDGPLGDGGVDARLVELAKKDRESSVCTIDFNLNKVASVNGITVLNINELAGSIRMAFLPGETMSLALTQKGQSDNQAVGYLADGTMVVVDKAGKDVGKTVQIEFIRSLQTAAGRMMFAKLADAKTPTNQPQTNSSSKRSAKTAGRKPAHQKATSTKAAHIHSAAKSPSSKKSNLSNEDSLIELLNNQ